MAEFHATARVHAPPAAVFAEVADLGTYPSWLSIVGRAEPAVAHPEDGGPAWQIDLQARVGPFTRSKRLRMVRTDHVPNRTVRFERLEHDGKSHGQWVLAATLSEHEPVELGMTLSYSGPGWIPGLDLLLRAEATRAGRRLGERLRDADASE